MLSALVLFSKSSLPINVYLCQRQEDMFLPMSVRLFARLFRKLRTDFDVYSWERWGVAQKQSIRFGWHPNHDLHQGTVDPEAREAGGQQGHVPPSSKEGGQCPSNF